MNTNKIKTTFILLFLSLTSFAQEEQGVTNKSSKVVAFDGLNHLFQHCKTGAITEYQEIEETISPDVLNMMVEWIKQNK